MSKSLWRSLGFLLTFSALVAFVLHPNHLLLNGEPGSAPHCNVCHTVPMGAVQPPVDHIPAAYVVYDVSLFLPCHPVNVFLSSESPRGPPAV